MHSGTCAHLVEHAACDCGYACSICGAELPCSSDHETRQIDRHQIRDRLDRGEGSRDEVWSDARALLISVERLVAEAPTPVALAVTRAPVAVAVPMRTVPRAVVTEARAG